jgi:WD40 repeat protein
VKKLLILNLHGDFTTGFDVNWEIGPDGQRPFANGMSKLALPPCPDLERVYQNWRDPYRRLDGNRIKQKPKQITNVRYTDLLLECKQTADILATVVNDWFDSSSLSKIIHTDLLTNLEDEYRVIICTDNPQVRQIPWLLWAGWQRFQYLEISLGAPYTQRRDRIYQQQVRVLVILGNSDGINIEADRQILEGYRQAGAHLEFLAQPTIDRLRQQLLDERGWDIISFSGHSRTESVNSGRIFLNHTDSLTMAQLRVELTTSIEKGLQLAIFNSCDGLGIAAELESLYIPQVIVMRQPVPDRVAQDFLKYFLAEFTSGKSLYQSVSIARDKLKQLESNFPCASWLPVIIQNRLEVPPTWQSLGSIPKCPYRGLAVFRAEDWEYFHGRESFTQALAQAVNAQSIVPLIGASGSGKSSVVFAGLIPQLRQDKEHPWQIVSLRSGDSPIKALSIAVSSLIPANANPEEDRLLASELAQNIQGNELGLINFITEHHIDRGQRLLFIIDQFEELYTLEIDKSDRFKFLKNILNALDRFPAVKLLFTLRADCYNYILQDTVLVTALAAINNKLLIPMTRSELTNAIFIPAQKLNVRFEAGLIEKILDSVFTSDYSLPLLEFALTQLWEKQQDGWLTHRAYQDIGGVEKALVNHATALFYRLTPTQQKQTRNIFVQLVRLDNNILPSRRVTKRSEIGEKNWELINYLATGRLVVTDWDEISQQETVELIHESLIFHWKTFQLWIELDGDFRRWQEQLRSSISQWQKSDNDESGLLRGKSLDTAVDWLTEYSSQVSTLEREFIDRSLAKQQQENKAKKRLQRSIIGSLAGGLIIVSFFWQQAETQRRAAVSNNIISLATNAELLFDRNNQLDALKKAKEAAQLISKEGNLSSEIILPTIATLEDIIDRIREKRILTPRHNGTVTSVAYNQDNNTIVSVSSVGHDGYLNIYGADGNNIQSLSTTGEKFVKLLVSNDGQDIITVSSPNILRLWHSNLTTGKWSNENPIPVDKNITAVALSLNSQVLAVALDGGGIQAGGGVQLYRNFNHTLHKDRLLPITDYIDDLKFTPDGQKIIAANADGSIKSIKIWTDRGQQLTPIRKPAKNKKILVLAISPDGKKIAAGDEKSTIQIWDIQGNLLGHTTHSDRKINDLNFSPDSQLLASVASDNRDIKIWKINDSKLELSELLPGETSDIQSVNFSPDGKTLVSVNTDGSVGLWQVNNPHPIVPDSAKAFSYSPDGQLLALGTLNGDVTIIDRKQQKILHSFPANHDTKITELSVSIDRHLATVGYNNQVKLWTIDGKEVKTSKPLIGNHCTFSPSQPILAIATIDKKISIYDVNGQFITNLDTKQSSITHLSFTPDGSKIVTGDTNGRVKLWNLDGIKLWDISLDRERIVDVSYNPDRDIIAIASSKDNVSKISLIWQHDRSRYLLDANGITALTFSQDGKVLLTGNENGKLQLWNLNGKLLKDIIGSSIDDRISNISKVRFSTDDREIVAMGIEGKIIHHNLNLEQLLEKAHNWIEYSNRSNESYRK